MKNKFYPLVKNPFKKEDIELGIKVLKSKKLTMGKETKKLEQMICKKLKIKYAAMVNSGSSANLLAFQCLVNPYRKNRLCEDDEVIIPAICWSTSFWPIVQSNLKPVFVDVDPVTLNIDEKELKKRITKKTRAIMLIHVLGNSSNMKTIMKIKKKYNLILVEDTCESFGSIYKKNYLGSFGDFASFSFYTSHQISAGEGGVVCCKNSDDYEIIKSLRSHGWTRNLNIHKKIKFDKKYLDKKFLFYNSGFNLRPTEISAIIARNQISQHKKKNKIRNQNRLKIINKFLSNSILRDKFGFIEANENVTPSWFCLTMFIKDKSINKNKFLEELELHGVETRAIISGNFARQPVFKKYKIINSNKFKKADYISQYYFFIGLYPNPLKESELNKLINIFLNCYKKIKK
jgi:CDP-6-deoxy-D-xylo-4-hexulose-3-dehydrase|tara:strand:+ start:49 stop:1257 length:1209 start_codon:yes stop_codon:yes gene_type:complete